MKPPPASNVLTAPVFPISPTQASRPRSRLIPIRNIVNFAAFYVGWFGCVFSAAQGHPWRGVLIVGAVLALHLRLSSMPKQDTQLAGISVLVGLMLETILVNGGQAAYAAPASVSWLPPVWILAMWVLLATTLNASLAWLQGRMLLAAVFGAVGAPLSYLAGERLGGMEILAPRPLNLAVMAILWIVALPALVKVAEWLRARASVVR